MNNRTERTALLISFSSAQHWTLFMFSTLPDRMDIHPSFRRQPDSIAFKARMYLRKKDSAFLLKDVSRLPETLILQIVSEYLIPSSRHCCILKKQPPPIISHGLAGMHLSRETSFRHIQIFFFFVQNNPVCNPCSFSLKKCY